MNVVRIDVIHSELKWGQIHLSTPLHLMILFYQSEGDDEGEGGNRVCEGLRVRVFRELSSSS